LDELRARARKACEDARFRGAVWRHCRYVDGAKLQDLDTQVHPGDQMLDHSLRHFGDANFAVSQYFNVALQQHNSVQQILRHAFPRDWRNRSVLDFACGFGRHLRLLTLAIPAENVWASEIQRDALEFVARFGVHGLSSSSDPAAFDPGRRFDLIWVASLFSHLPDALFHGWLGALLRLLTPEGLLCFSVHDERELSDPGLMTPRGIYFHPGSEIAELDLAVYGTSFVSHRYVDEAIGHAGHPGSSRLRIPRGIAGQQDLFVVSATGSDRLATLAFRKGPWGWVDEIRFADGALRIEGWAGSLDEGRIGEVEIRLDGESFRCPTDLSRGDVQPVVGDARCGFVFEARLDAAREVFVEVSAESRGHAALLYAGALNGS
jgi:SAM-dependent methyltransferase